MRSATRMIIGVLLLATFQILSAQPGSIKQGVKKTTQTTSKKITSKNQNILMIDGELANCQGTTSGKCMLVKAPGKKEYELFYDQIEGFTYEEGYKYTLQVKADTLKDMAADAFRIKYTLIKILSKTIAVQTQEGDIKIFQVFEETAPCDEVTGTKKCLLIKEPAQKEYELFHDPIEGFQYEEGNAYTLQVRVISMPGDAGRPMTFLYRLVKIVSQTKNGTAVSPSSVPKGDVKNTPITPASYDSTGLSGKAWQVQLFRVDTIAYDVRDLKMTLLVYPEQNRIGGKATCNNYFAGLSYTRTLFRIGVIGSTKMYCDNLMQAEDLYFKTLSSCDQYEIREGILYLKKGDKTLIELK